MYCTIGNLSRTDNGCFANVWISDEYFEDPTDRFCVYEEVKETFQKIYDEEKENSEVACMELQSQFRCDGSDGYLAWIDDVLNIRKTANYNLEDINYDIRVVDSPNDVRQLVIEHDKAPNHARILADYCKEREKQYGLS